MLKDKSTSQFQVIVHTLARDISVSWGRGGWNHGDFSETVAHIVHDYARYYSRHNVHLSITDLTQTEQSKEAVTAKINFDRQGDRHYIYVSGLLPEPFGYFLLDYRLDITENIAEMSEIQNVLLISAVIFSIVAAIALLFILSAIFRPLDVVAKASREIAEGKFDERICIKGNNELAQVAYDFNKMAEKIESQIIYLEEEAENKQQFVDNFAHEIRTPLTSIYGYAEYMNKVSLNENEIIESTAYIMGEADHMKNIASSLLELATLRNYVPIKNEILIPKLFDDIAGTMEKSLRENGVRLICNSNSDVLNGQEDLIRSLILNLCTNALKACTTRLHGREVHEGNDQAKEGIIQLEAKSCPEATVISVTDNGCGIPEESLLKVTEPFYRLDKPRNREDGGTGLGLTLCSQIVAAHGAQMVIKSNINIGTTVEIRFTTS